MDSVNLLLIAPNSYGLQPNSDGLHPSSDGLQPIVYPPAFLNFALLLAPSHVSQNIHVQADATHILLHLVLLQPRGHDS